VALFLDRCWDMCSRLLGRALAVRREVWLEDAVNARCTCDARDILLRTLVYAARIEGVRYNLGHGIHPYLCLERGGPQALVGATTSDPCMRKPKKQCRSKQALIGVDAALRHLVSSDELRGAPWSPILFTSV